MDDLISRQAAIDAVRCCIDVYITNQPTLIYKEDAYTALRLVPSAQPEIIRCKDCGKREVCRTSTLWAVAPGDDWYCADAERRTDE